MRFRLLLIILIAMPVLVVAQVEHQENVVFYNSGKMYVGVSQELSEKEGNDDAAYTQKDVRLYIEGSLKVVDNSQIKQRGGTALTGDFITASATGSPFTQNLIDLNPANSLVVGGTSVNLYQNNAIYFINNVLKVNADDNTEIIYKPGATSADAAVETKFKTGMALKQYIRRETRMAAGLEDKNTNILDFPNIVVGSVADAALKTTEAKSYLVVENDIAMTVPYVVVEPGAMFSVQSRPIKEEEDLEWALNNPTTGVPSLMTAHIKWAHHGYPFDSKVLTSAAALGAAGNDFVKGGYGVVRRYNNDLATGVNPTIPSTWNWSYAQHDLRLYDPAKPATNKRKGTGHDGKEKTMNYLYPFAPLMSGLRSDYLIFNTQYVLGKGDVTDLSNSNLDPKKPMGAATYVALDLTDYDYDVIQETHQGQGLLPANRAVGEILFSRKFLKARPGFDFFSAMTTTDVDSQGANPYIAEVINSKGVGESYDFPMDNSDVKFGRYRVIGNNSFLPLDLSSICVSDAVGDVTLDDIKVYKSSNPTQSQKVIVGKPSTNIYFRNKFWIPYNSVIYAERNPGNQPAGGPQTPTVYYYYIDYFEASNVGGNATLTGKDFLLAPMQVALLQMGNPAGAYDRISLSSNLFKHDNAVTVKSAPSLNTRTDELLLQIINEETGKEDRTVVVLREDGRLDGGNSYNSEKLTPMTNVKVGVGFSELTKTTADEMQAMIEGTIYTKTSKNLRMTTNVVPSDIKQLPLYVVPPVSKTAEFTITPYRTETMQTVDEVWLEDKHTNKFTLLTAETKYKFQAEPLTGDEAEKNRFVLHFGKLAIDEDIKGDSDKDITCSYSGSTLSINGLNPKDIGSDVQIYDMQGRLMGKMKINNVPTEFYNKYLAAGAYIIKISGARNYTTKLLNLQN